MILKINGNINKYYVQTLCMVFFPGATFSESEQPGIDVPEVTVDVYNDSEQTNVTAYVSIKLNDKLCEATESVSLSEEINFATHEAIAVGRAVFAAGKELLGHTPPWGILTGVRPAKVANSILRSGKGILKTKKVLRDEYFLNPQKAALAVSVANAEYKMMKKTPKNTCSLYISIPFCPSRCAYCSFVSYTTKRLLSMVEDYLNALVVDIDDTIDTINKLGLSVSTVYIGGGTPTTLSAEQLERLLSKITERVDVNNLRLIEKKKEHKQKTASMSRSGSMESRLTASADNRCDLRGMTVDDCLIELDRLIDYSMRTGVNDFTVVHGKGTGALKNAVRQYLKKSPFVKTSRPGVYGEGEDGVTIVTLK